MKSAIRMSAIMLTLFAAIFMTSCGSKGGSDANKLAGALNDIASAFDSQNDQKALDAVDIIQSLTNSNEEMTKENADVIGTASYKIAIKMADMMGTSIPSEAKTQIIAEVEKYSTVGQCATAMYDGMAGMLGL